MDAYGIWHENSLFLEKFSLIRVWKFPVQLHREFRCKLLNRRVDQTLKSPWIARFCKIPCYFPCYTSTQRRPEKPLVDTGGQVDSGVVDDSPWIFVRSGARRTDSGRAGWPCGAPGGAAGGGDVFFLYAPRTAGGAGGA